MDVCVTYTNVLHGPVPLQEKCAQYWPSDGAVVHGDISIEIKREDECESYTVRDLLVTNNRVRWDRHTVNTPVSLFSLFH